MSNIVSYSIKSNKHRGKELLVCLNPDKSLNPYTFEPPIIWSGTIGGSQVKITQTNNHSDSETDFDWSLLPVEFHDLKESIIKAISIALDIMN